jgi:hypothetical protein
MHHLLQVYPHGTFICSYDSSNETGSTLTDQFLCLLRGASRIYVQFGGTSLFQCSMRFCRQLYVARRERLTRDTRTDIERCKGNRSNGTSVV